jgi:hypothetical protein
MPAASTFMSMSLPSPAMLIKDPTAYLTLTGLSFPLAGVCKSGKNYIKRMLLWTFLKVCMLHSSNSSIIYALRTPVVLALDIQYRAGIVYGMVYDSEGNKRRCMTVCVSAGQYMTGHDNTWNNTGQYMTVKGSAGQCKTMQDSE